MKTPLSVFPNKEAKNSMKDCSFHCFVGDFNEQELQF